MRVRREKRIQRENQDPGTCTGLQTHRAQVVGNSPALSAGILKNAGVHPSCTPALPAASQQRAPVPSVKTSPARSVCRTVRAASTGHPTVSSSHTQGENAEFFSTTVEFKERGGL